MIDGLAWILQNLAIALGLLVGFLVLMLFLDRVVAPWLLQLRRRRLEHRAAIRLGIGTPQHAAEMARVASLYTDAPSQPVALAHSLAAALRRYLPWALFWAALISLRHWGVL